jgi:mRNA interferase MazF
MDIRRGEIYLVSLDPTVGSEIKKTRPALIIQNDVGNKYSPLTIVAPITSTARAKKYPTEVNITAKESGLDSDSTVLLNQIRTVDTSRIVRKLGALSQAKMREVDEAIRISLAIS